MVFFIAQRVATVRETPSIVNPGAHFPFRENVTRAAWEIRERERNKKKAGMLTSQYNQHLNRADHVRAYKPVFLHAL